MSTHLVFLSQFVVHDWRSDEDCVKILMQCKKAIQRQKPGGKIIVIDVVVGHPSASMFKANVALDFLTMVLTSGKERDEKEWSKIFMQAGFVHYKI